MERLCGFLLLLIWLLTGTGCERQKKAPAKEQKSQQAMMGDIMVDTMHLHAAAFDNQIVCNGHLRAVAKSVLSFKQAGVVARINVREGQYVSKGALIASVDDNDIRRQVEKAQHEVERGRVVLVDKLIGWGYDTDMKGVPADKLQRAEITSGYYAAKFELQTAKNKLRDCYLYAPFAGRIADIEAKECQVCDKVCTLIDDSRYDVEFKVLEAELPYAKVGETVKVSPFTDDSSVYAGKIRDVNPIVDEKGLIRITAQMTGGKASLMDGLNVKVVIEQRVTHMFSVPKEAVLERDGYHVVFLYRGGEAVWTYVDILHANIDAYAITGCARKHTTIREGDSVIISGNLNLADGTKVKIASR